MCDPCGCVGGGCVSMCVCVSCVGAGARAGARGAAGCGLAAREPPALS